MYYKYFRTHLPFPSNYNESNLYAHEIICIIYFIPLRLSNVKTSSTVDALNANISNSQKPTKYTFPRQSRCDRNSLLFMYVQDDHTNFTLQKTSGMAIIIITKIVRNQKHFVNKLYNMTLHYVCIVFSAIIVWNVITKTIILLKSFRVYLKNYNIYHC